MRRGSRLVTVTSATLTLGCAGLMDAASGPSSHISYRADQTCYRSFPEDCPPDASCNPPPPEEIECPPISSQRIVSRADGTCERVVVLECPEDTSCSSAAQPVDCPSAFVRSISRSDDGTCTAYRELECPEGHYCDTPPPASTDCPATLTEPGTVSLSYVYGCLHNNQPAECPPELVLRPISADYTIEVNGDGSCTAYYNGPSDCPLEASCNPPPPENISCPPDAPSP